MHESNIWGIFLDLASRHLIKNDASTIKKLKAQGNGLKITNQIQTYSLISYFKRYKTKVHSFRHMLTFVGFYFFSQSSLLKANTFKPTKISIKWSQLYFAVQMRDSTSTKPAGRLTEWLKKAFFRNNWSMWRIWLIDSFLRVKADLLWKHSFLKKMSREYHLVRSSGHW